MWVCEGAWTEASETIRMWSSSNSWCLRIYGHGVSTRPHRHIYYDHHPASAWLTFFCGGAAAAAAAKQRSMHQDVSEPTMVPNKYYYYYYILEYILGPSVQNVYPQKQRYTCKHGMCLDVLCALLHQTCSIPTHVHVGWGDFWLRRSSGRQSWSRPAMGLVGRAGPPMALHRPCPCPSRMCYVCLYVPSLSLSPPNNTRNILDPLDLRSPMPVPNTYIHTRTHTHTYKHPRSCTSLHPARRP